MANTQSTKKLTGIIELGGKQHLISDGAKIVVNRLNNQEGETINAKDMLGGADVKLKVVSHMLGKKINGLKFKSKVRYTRRYGHRQQLTTLEVVANAAPKAEIKEVVAKPVVKKAAAKK